MITPEQLARVGTEDAHQQAIFCQAAIKINENPERYGPLKRLFFAVPNGGDRGSVIVGTKLKSTGVKKGVADMLLLYPRARFHGLCIELKKLGLENRKNGGMSEEQVEFKDAVVEQGYAFACAYGWEQAWFYLEKYLDLPAPTPPA